LHRGGNHAFREFSSLRTHFPPAYYMRLVYVNMVHVNNISTLAKGLHEQHDLDSTADSREKGSERVSRFRGAQAAGMIS
jgi:hypothetical protein